MENANASWVLQNGSYEAYLAANYAYAADFYSVRHSSQPSYMAATSGTDSNQLRVTSTKNIADLLKTAGLTWGDYQQSMPTVCDTSNNAKKSFPYSPGHNPFVWYKDVESNKSLCDSHVVGFTPLLSEIQSGTLPNYSFVVANEYNDAHGDPYNNLQSTCPPFAAWETNVSCGDSWLRGFLPSILNSTTSEASSTAVLLTYDEANDSDTRGIGGTVGGGIVYTVVAGACARLGYTSTTPYETYSDLTTAEWLLNLGTLNQHDSMKKYPPLKNLFSPSCLSDPSVSVSWNDTAFSSLGLLSSADPTAAVPRLVYPFHLPAVRAY